MSRKSLCSMVTSHAVCNLNQLLIQRRYVLCVAEFWGKFSVFSLLMTSFQGSSHNVNPSQCFLSLYFLSSSSLRVCVRCSFYPLQVCSDWLGSCQTLLISFQIKHVSFWSQIFNYCFLLCLPCTNSKTRALVFYPYRIKRTINFTYSHLVQYSMFAGHSMDNFYTIKKSPF